MSNSSTGTPKLEFSLVDSPSVSQNLQKSTLFIQVSSQTDLEVPSRASGHRRQRTLSQNMESTKNTDLTTLHSFYFSVPLLNYFRDPEITFHQFSNAYLASIAKELSQINNRREYDEIIIYIHLIVAQIQNLEQMKDMEVHTEKIVKFNKHKWNTTNIMNAACLMVNLQGLLNQNAQIVSQGGLYCQLIKEKNIYRFQGSCIQISHHYVKQALDSNGHWDVYFGPFLLDLFPYEATLWFNNFKTLDKALTNYSLIYKQMITESQIFQNLDWQDWYNKQVANITQGKFHPDEMINAINFTSMYKNPWVEKLLIGLQGWDELISYSIRYLNVFIDGCDWQHHQAYNSSIATVDDSFQINYLIQKQAKYRDSLVICLKAPCFNSKYHGQYFSWHVPNITQYISDDQSYLWLKLNYGTFPKSGYYDWAAFFLNDSSKQTINKILNSQTSQKLQKETKNKQMITVRSVKGRIIAQPKGTKDLFLHQLYIDSINSEQGLLKASTFASAVAQLQNLARSGINCVYLIGVFERDNDQRAGVYRRPNASPLAFTHRTLICQMLGGQAQFKQLVKRAHQLGLKIIVDCSTRVSSSRMAKQYQKLRLRNLDEQGRIVYHYGGNGRSNSYKDTTQLNYRKKQAWDLLHSEILSIIQKYNVDGIYLDNGFQWPPIYQINKDEMLRLQAPNKQPTYSLQEIFQGQIIQPGRAIGFWAHQLNLYYSNPFLLKLTKSIWQKYPSFHVIAQGLQIDDPFRSRILSVIRSGAVPRMFQLPKALAQVAGFHLHNNGQITQQKPLNVNDLHRSYQNFLKALPPGAIIVHSTTSPVWPYLAYIFRKATWAVVDLYFLLPALVMTSGQQQSGKAYKTKSFGINYLTPESEFKGASETVEFNLKSFARANSSFFQGGKHHTMTKGSIVQCFNTNLRDPSQIRSVQESFRKDVGPQFGFDLGQIHKHYAHRRELRASLEVLKQGKMLSLTAQHMYGKHKSVFSFARYDQQTILLISINFNAEPIDMHYNLTPLKVLFKNWQRSSLVMRLQNMLNPQQFVNEYYMVSELINSKIEARIEPYKTIIWKLTQANGKLEQAINCSGLRMKQRLARRPPAWIYSSVFFNQLNHLLQNGKTRLGMVNGLNRLYQTCILPNNFDLSLVINKNYEFYINKHKLEKLFGVFKLVDNHPYLKQQLQGYIEAMLNNNVLGPIAFVTPQIGSWSSVGGLGVMVDQLSKQLARLGQEVYMITPYYEYNKKNETNYLKKDGFEYERNISVGSAHFNYQLGIHRGKYCGVNYVWFHNPQLFSRVYDGQGAMYVSKQLVFFALATLESFCQLKIFPSICVTNDWMCGFVSAYVKCNKYKDVFSGTKFMHICHNLDPLYEGRLYPKIEEGNLNWLIQLPSEWYTQHRNNKLIINPSRCALQTCDNWGTVSHSYKVDLLKESPLASVLWKHPHPFSFPNGIRKDERFSILLSKTPGSHLQSKKILQQKYFKCEELRNQIPLLAFIGRVTKQKGVHLILDVIESLILQYGRKIQFLVGGMASSKQQYSKYCADKMRYLNYKYPDCFWSNPDQFFVDGPLVNFGSDFALMPSQFEPGGIVQHEFFCGYTPVVAFRTGGLKDTVFEFDPKTRKGNGFNFMAYQHQDFKNCLRRALAVYKDQESYLKLRQNAFESVIQQEDVAKGWNNQFYRMQNKVYIDWLKVDHEMKQFNQGETGVDGQDLQMFKFQQGEFWKPQWVNVNKFKEVLKDASRLKMKEYSFCFQTTQIPRPKQVILKGTWDDWKKQTKLIFDKIQKKYKISIKLQPGIYQYKYTMDGEWCLTENQEQQTDMNGNVNHIARVQ